MRLLIYLFILLLVVYTSNAQGSLSNCKFNGIDYSFLANSTSYSSTDSSGLYTYYFNICQASSKCNNNVPSGNIAACQIKNSYLPTPIGTITQGTFSNSNNGVVLNYRTNTNQCKNGVFRNINIYLTPNNNGIKSISQVQEESSCSYGVTISYPNPSSSSSENDASSGDSCKNDTIIAKNENNGIMIQSFTNINCISYGETYCVDGKGSICQNNASNPINCNSDGTDLIACSSSNIMCISGGNSFSILSGQFYVNGELTDQNVVILDVNGCNKVNI